jgi:hypothetical protein
LDGQLITWRAALAATNRAMVGNIQLLKQLPASGHTRALIIVAESTEKVPPASMIPHDDS